MSADHVTINRVSALSSADFIEATNLLELAVSARDIPSAVAAVGTKRDITIIFAQGVRRYVRPDEDEFVFVEDVSIHESTLFDLAEVSQVMATLPAILKLLSGQYLNLHDRVGRFFSNAGWLQTNPIADVTIAQLLTHTAGLPAWKPLFAETNIRKTAIANLLQTELLYEPGEWVQSDLGFMVLGAIIERVTHMRQDDFVQHFVFEPLDMLHTTYGPVMDSPVAATEDCGWRDQVLEGIVHDENAFVMDHVAGHAGLFSNAIDMAMYAQAWLKLDSRLADEAILAQAISEQVVSEDVRYGLGWSLASGSSDVKSLSARAYGLDGFTGTSLWIDPEQEWFALLLTNAVHPHRSKAIKIHDLRRKFYERISRAFLA
jgi:CubicO group peptidase (beta-lactamase class C family)